ncbi:MAG: hypothetical protein GY898_30485 [Proteobacteria bacterium]|nr:hypothetical protein [Pseudomonadota bacterium]
MGFFDRLTNLGKGWVSSKTKGTDRDAKAELDALDGQHPLPTAETPAAATAPAPKAAVEPTAPAAEPEEEPAFGEPRDRVKKTL